MSNVADDGPPSAGSHLRTPEVYLRCFELNDVDVIYAWQNSVELYDKLVGNFMPVSRKTVQEWLLLKAAWSEKEVNWIVCLAATNQPLGVVYLRDVNPQASIAELHVYIGDTAHRGAGYGTAAVRLALRYAFVIRGLHRVYLHVLASNTGATRMYERLGFRNEGCLRQHALKHRMHHDVLIMGLLATEYSP